MARSRCEQNNSSDRSSAFCQDVVHRFVVSVNAPLLHQAVFHHRQPGRARPPLVFGRELAVLGDSAACRTEHTDFVPVLEDLFMRIVTSEERAGTRQ